MKLSIFCYSLLTIILSVGCNTAAEGQVPKEVKTTFKNMYPKENDPDWHKDKNGNFESNFKKDGEHYKADFSPEGQWLETERRISKKDLPDAIKEKIDKDFKDYELVEIEEVDHNSKGRFYDLEFKIDGEKKDVEFNAQGSIIN
ncbi:PepSY-like domain-containing protein [Arenibacter sp. F26102]|uniref:PepSY-like domain-containing protein n=1 Tax=Arenibacter sp. F26102 TaxID=2926416 RepID=UPI001FF23C54|nr:PepSY-like domain-containing protein [Arenibacter sp. F26102]MCK0146276.1 PepSY-like domain-containing protein [Arenibacter sp. F26102]